MKTTRITIPESRRRALLAIVILLATLALACGRGQGTAAPTQPPPPPAATFTPVSPPGPPPAAPSNCQWRLAADPHRIIVSFEYGDSSGIDGFRLYYAETTLLAEVGRGEREVTSQSLEPSTQYHLDVRAFKGGQESKIDVCSVDATTGQ